MVDEADGDERERFGEPLGDGAIGDTWLRNARRMPVPDDEGGGVVHQRAPHHDARMDGGAIHCSTEELFVGYGLVARVKEDRDEDLGAPPSKAGFEVAPGEVRRGEGAVAAKPRFHPSGVQLEDGMHPSAVLAGEEEQAQHVVRIVEELARAPPRGGERRGVDVDADEPEAWSSRAAGPARLMRASSASAEGGHGAPGRTV